MVTCCVPLCSNSSKGNSIPVSFHVFPKDATLQKQWIVNIRRDPGPNFNLIKGTVVCSAHFTSEDFNKKGYTNRKALKPTAVPTIFEWTSTNQRKPPTSRKQATSKGRSCQDCSDESCDNQSASTPVSNCHSQVTHSDPPSYDHDYMVERVCVDKQLEAARAEIQRLSSEVTTLKERCLYTRFSKDPKLIQFYTGFQDYTTFISFFQAIEPSASSMTSYTQYQRLSSGQSKSHRFSFAHNLSLIDQLTLTLRKLRLGTFDQELADQYQVSVSTVSRTFLTWINYLYFVLGSMPLWPSKQQVQDHMPDVFKEDYPNTRVILDCTEIFVQRPSSLVLNTEFYSHYKSTTTLKALVGITPSGAISFVSKLYPGSISDKAITKCSGILGLIEAGDEVMVDKGFVIQDLLNPLGANLVIPPFLTANRSQFDAEEVFATQTIARLRVHVERAIRRVKFFHIFDGVIPLSLAGSVNQMWSICCLLTNFSGDLL